jgi:hypothetical protein
MSRPPADQPERLLAADATDFERRVLGAAMQTKPSPEASARMAKALGITAATIGTGVGVTTAATNAAAATATATAGTTAASSWISIGVIVLVVAGAVVGARMRHSDSPRHNAPTPASAAVPAQAERVAPTEPPTVVPAPPPRAAAPSPRSRVTQTAGDLSEQVALLDAARAAVSTGAGQRALEIVRRYQEKYPTGAFRPEATAIRVEALMKVGRTTEAQELAERLIAAHRGTLLARRVADVAGLTGP